MKSQIHFVLGAGVYPYLTGGMEIFNYYLIQTLHNNFKISYTSYFRLNYEGVKFKRCLPIKPTKYLFPIQLFFHLLFTRKVKCVLFSYSAAHAIVWRSYNLICRALHKKYIAVIHYGDVTPSKDIETYKRFFRDAEIVITDSYHGMLFSIIFGRKFWSVERAYQQYDQSSRQITILKKLGLESKYIIDCKDISMEEVDYVVVQQNIERLRKESLSYLKQAIVSEL